MKKITYILPVCLLACMSCEDFLKEDPQSFLAPESYYQTADDLNAGLNAVYRAPQDRFCWMWAAPSWFEWGTDEGEITDKSTWAFHNEIARLPSTFDASATVPNDLWEHTYNHVKDANNLLRAIPNVDINETDRKRIEGQTRALRALLYFDAVQVFNDIPLLLEATTDIEYLKTVTRTPAAEVYEAIIADLKYAMDVLPSVWENAVDQGRITSGGAAAMLAKVYLTMSGYPLNKTEHLESARVLLENFVDKKTYGSHYQLLPEYSMIFDDATGPGNEGAWVINFTKGTFNQGNGLHVEFAPLELYYAQGIGLEYGGGWSNTLPTDRFYNSYDQANDKRFHFTYWTSTAEIPEEYDALVPADENGNPVHIVFDAPHIKKFRERTPNDNGQWTNLDHNVIRYADVLLMYAEVLNQLGDQNCYTYLNQVRDRAGLQPVSGLSKEAFHEHLMLERAWELCYEGHRRFDLVRWGVYITRTPEWNPQVVGNIKANKHEFWPIPRSERDINPNLTQNPGW